MFMVSSERPCRNQKPSSSMLAQSPCTQTSGHRRQYVSRYRSGSPHTPLVMAGHGFLHTSSPTSPGATGLPSGPQTSTSMPSEGPRRVHGFSSVMGSGERKQAPTSVPPEMLMIGHRLPPTSSKNHMYGSGFHGSPVDPRMRSDDRSWRRTCSSPAGISARIMVGEMPRVVMRWRSTMS